MELLPYLKVMAKHQASDLFFSTGTTPRMKIEGVTHSIGEHVLQAGEVKDMAYDLLSEEQVREFDQSLELNTAISVKSMGRFRINLYRQRGEVSMVLRYIKIDVPSFEELTLPEVLKELIFEPRGLVLVVGATGSGKSTTLAAMIEYRNATQAGHILTIEDPIEYIYSHKRSVVDQREVGLDTLSYESALKNALREAPDVILIGEVRDMAAMQHALTYADTGHLCLSTLHANNAHQALERIIGFFPETRHRQLLEDLSMNLRGIVSQRLLRSADGKRLPAVEVLINKPHISELIKKGNLAGVKDAIERDQTEGMIAMDSAIFELFDAGRISQEEALSHADSRVNLEVKMRFGGGGTDEYM